MSYIRASVKERTSRPSGLKHAFFYSMAAIILMSLYFYLEGIPWKDASRAIVAVAILFAFLGYLSAPELYTAQGIIWT